MLIAAGDLDIKLRTIYLNPHIVMYCKYMDFFLEFQLMDKELIFMRIY